MNQRLSELDRLADAEQTRGYDMAVAFNAGSDARIAGVSREDNPYSPSTAFRERGQWDMGWRDVDQHWGEAVKVGATLKRLPEVGGK